MGRVGLQKKKRRQEVDQGPETQWWVAGEGNEKRPRKELEPSIKGTKRKNHYLGEDDTGGAIAVKTIASSGAKTK